MNGSNSSDPGNINALDGFWNVPAKNSLTLFSPIPHLKFPKFVVIEDDWLPKKLAMQMKDTPVMYASYPASCNCSDVVE